MHEIWMTEFGCRFVLILARVTGLLAMAPALGGRTVPRPIRAVGALVLALVLLPALSTIPLETSPLVVGALACREGLIGLALGLVARMTIVSAQIAGQWLGNTSGLVLSETFAPDADGELSALGGFFQLVAVATLVASGGHRQIVAALLDSFAWIPPGAPTIPAALLSNLNDVVAESLRLSVRLAAPLLAALLSATLLTAVVGRAIPQFNALAVSSTGNTLLILALLATGLGGIGWLFEEQITTSLQQVEAALTCPEPSLRAEHAAPDGRRGPMSFQP